MQRIDMRHLILGLGCVTAAAVGWTLWSGPEPSQAAISDLGGLCVLEPNCTGVSLDEVSPEQWNLVVGVRWTCPDSHPGIASAVGSLRLASKEDSSVAVVIPCRVDVPVSSGAPLLATERTEWDESDPRHRWLRGADPCNIDVTFDADWFRPVRSRGSVAGPPPSEGGAASSNNNYLQAGRGFRRVDARTGLAR